MNNNLLQFSASLRWPGPARHEFPPVRLRGPDDTSQAGSDGSMAVFIVDADEAHRASLLALTRCGRWHAQGLATVQELLGRVPHPGPSCLVLDAAVQHPGGLELQRRLSAERMEMPIIFIAGDADVPMAVQAMKAGAMDFLTRPVSGHRLLYAIEDALAHSRALLERTVSMRAIQARHATLSRREQEVMSLVVAGLLNKQVGAELGISEITVKAHRGSAMRKMGARSLPDLVNMANRLQGALAG